MDAVYVVTPFWYNPSSVYQAANQKESGMPSIEELLDRYTEKAGFDPRKEKWEVAQIFHLLRVSVT
jgi:aminoglycoside phosphotransferase (APT) family kinase protein